MKIKTLLIEIYLSNHIKKTDLDLRHVLVDTIESRNLGEVVEETSSPEALEVVIEHPANKNIEQPVKDILLSLGFDSFKMEYLRHIA